MTTFSTNKENRSLVKRLGMKTVIPVRIEDYLTVAKEPSDKNERAKKIGGSSKTKAVDTPELCCQFELSEVDREKIKRR